MQVDTVLNPFLGAISEGTVVEIDTQGVIHITVKGSREALPCRFLRTHAEPLPSLVLGDTVAYILGGDGDIGYIIGLVESHQTAPVVTHLPARDAKNPKRESLQVDGERMVFEAEREIEFKCGKGRFIIRKDGTIIIRGEHLTSHARQLNKLRGSSIQVN